MTSSLFHTADLLHSPDSLSVQWRSAPGEVPRPVEAALQERIAQQLKALAETERARGPTASPRLTAAQHQSESLHEELFRISPEPRHSGTLCGPYCKRRA